MTDALIAEMVLLLKASAEASRLRIFGLLASGEHNVE